MANPSRKNPAEKRPMADDPPGKRSRYYDLSEVRDWEKGKKRRMLSQCVRKKTRHEGGNRATGTAWTHVQNFGEHERRKKKASKVQEKKGKNIRLKPPLAASPGRKKGELWVFFTGADARPRWIWGEKYKRTRTETHKKRGKKGVPETVSIHD